MTHSVWADFARFADVDPAADAHGAPSLDEVRQRRTALLAAAARHGASAVRIVGSVARGTAGPRSDVDLLVSLPPSYSLLDLGALHTAFGEILGRRVDVVVQSELKQPMRSAVLRDAVAV